MPRKYAKRTNGLSHPELWQAFAADRSDANRNALIESYLPLAKRVAHYASKKLPPSVDADDVTSFGVLGLIGAINAFDLGRGVKFETYCVPRIRGAILDELRCMDWVPRQLREQSKALSNAVAKLDKRLGRRPTDDELATELGLDRRGLKKLLYDTRQTKVTSLNDNVNNPDGRPTLIVNTIADARAVGPERASADLDTLRRITRGLNRRERLVIILYYYEDCSMREIGETLNLSESRVSQMHSQLLRRLRKRLGSIAIFQLNDPVATLPMAPETAPKRNAPASPATDVMAHFQRLGLGRAA